MGNEIFWDEIVLLHWCFETFTVLARFAFHISRILAGYLLEGSMYLQITEATSYFVYALMDAGPVIQVVGIGDSTMRTCHRRQKVSA